MMQYYLQQRMRPVVTVLATLWLAFACTSDKRQSGDHTGTPHENTMRVGTIGAFRQAHPHTFNSGYLGLTFKLVYEALFTLDDQMVPIPRLAKSLSETKEGKHLLVTAELHSNIVGHDHRSIDAQDVVANYRCALKLKKQSWIHPFIETLETVTHDDGDAYKVRFQFSDPSAYSPLALTLPIVQAEHTACALDKKEAKVVPGTGHYRITHYGDKAIEFKRFDKYWKQPAKIDTIHLRAFESKRAAWSGVVRQNVDLLMDFSTASSQFTQSQPHLKVVQLPMNFFHMIVFNTRQQHMGSQRFRKALNLAVNREYIVSELLGGGAQLSATLLHPNSLPKDYKPTPYPYDPRKALSLLTLAGFQYDSGSGRLFAKGRPVRLRGLGIQHDEDCERILLAIQRDLQQIGIEMDVSLVPPGALTSALRTTNADLTFLYSRAYSDLTMIEKYVSGSYNDGLFPYTNDRLRKLYARWRAADDSNPERWKAELSNILFDDPPGIFLYWKTLSVAMNTRVAKHDINSGNFWGDITRWQLEP